MDLKLSFFMRTETRLNLIPDPFGTVKFSNALLREGAVKPL